MTRVVSAGRSHGLIALGALGATLVAISLTGCPGTLDPSKFPLPMMGAAGTTGAAGTGAAGTGAAGTGAAGTGAAGTGAAGTGAAGTGALPGCATAQALFDSHMCTLAGACHDATGAAANFKMAPAGWETHLVGVNPAGGGATPSICAKDAAFMMMPYIVAKSNPATGLLISKLKGAVCAPAGARMPNLGTVFTATELQCIQDWATKLANP
jgi:hypothetical protein